MRKVKPIMVRTPEELARSLGLAVAEAKEGSSLFQVG